MSRKQTGGPASPPVETQPAATQSGSSASTVADRADRWLALSDERDRYLARILTAERAAYQRGYEDGRADETAKEWDAGHELSVRLKGDNREPCYCHPMERDKAARRVGTALAYTRWAAEHQWRQFTRRAFATRPEYRTAAQRATVQACRRGGAA